MAPPLTHHCHIIETGNESCRFRHGTPEAKGRIKTREQTRKAAAAQVSEAAEEGASPDGSAALSRVLDESMRRVQADISK